MTREELASALRKADAAGNAEDARKLAAAIRKLDTQAAPPIEGTATPVATAPQAPSRTPLGGATGEFDPAAFEALPKTQQRAPLPKPVDPLAPTDPAQIAGIEDRRKRAEGLIPLDTGSGAQWVPDPSAQLRQIGDQKRAALRRRLNTRPIAQVAARSSTPFQMLCALLLRLQTLR